MCHDRKLDVVEMTDLQKKIQQNISARSDTVHNYVHN